MAKIINFSFDRVTDGLGSRPTDQPLISVKQSEVLEHSYILTAALFLNASAHNFMLEEPSKVHQKTEAGKIPARGFTLRGKADLNEAAYSLWTLEIVYSIDPEDSLPYEYLEIVMDSTEGEGPGTKRGTVTTVDDPSPQGETA